MKREKTGELIKSSSSGKGEFFAFVPTPLPPEPALKIDGELQSILDKANNSLGRLDSITGLLPDPYLFLYMYVRKEAVLSSQIEGTQSSLADLLLFEMEEMPGVPMDDVKEISNYVNALNYGKKRLKEDFPLALRLIKEIHSRLLKSGRGKNNAPGEFRKVQNWIGGSSPVNAVFVPPPANYVEECMGSLEKFINDEKEKTPVLIKAALAHLQFETIHPFLDGNGRLGRMLISLILFSEGVFKEPILYLSLYFKSRRKEYYEMLQSVRTDGDWERWIRFFVEGVIETAEGAVHTAKRLVEMFEEDKTKIRKLGRAAGSAIMTLEAMQKSPISSAEKIKISTKLSFPASLNALENLERLGIVKEITGKRRNRIYGYPRYMKILNEGTEPL